AEPAKRCSCGDSLARDDHVPHVGNLFGSDLRGRRMRATRTIVEGAVRWACSNRDTWQRTGATPGEPRQAVRPDQGGRGNSDQLDHHFADVLALKETDESVHGVLDAVHDRFLVLELASLKVATHFLFKVTLTV